MSSLKQDFDGARPILHRLRRIQISRNHTQAVQAAFLALGCVVEVYRTFLAFETEESTFVGFGHSLH